MKQLMSFSSLIFLFLFSSLASAQRLPELASPENYQLTLTPNFTTDKFAGEETIRVRVLKPTSQIVLNSAEIDFQSATVTSGGATQTAKVTLDKEKEMATLAFQKEIPAGAASLHIVYSGILNDELRGFYLGKDKEGRKYAVTQFEATDARRAFPSFDEPAYKATFDVTVVADKGLTAISNGRVLSDKPGPGPDQHTVKFATTAKMSSYLVALAVGNFEYIEGNADGIPIRVWGPPGSKPYSGYALQVAEQCMKYYNQYFGIKYPFEKLDMLGLPDFAAGAMENTGFITYREVILQLDDKNASVGLHKEVALVVAHEMAHQWFGDLVTMQWWDDIWLNEGFATWMESKAVEAWKPEWNIDLDDVEGTVQALNVDSLKNTRPIHQAAETPGEIQELFDGIAYGKTAAVLRMLEAYLGPESFRQGVDAYLKKHEYANATATDFWSALTAVSKKPVDQVMPTFVNQPGAPMVSAQTQCSAGSESVTLAQKRYFYDRSLFEQGNDELWQVPVCMKEGQAGRVGKVKCVLLKQKQESFTLDGCGPWVMVNAGGNGYYRSGYPGDAVRAMSHDLEKDLSPAERIMLLSDSWAAVRVNEQQIGDYLALAEGLQSDRNRAVLEALTGELDYIGEYLVTDADRNSYEAWVRRLLTPAAQDLGWASKPGESDEMKELRARVMFTLGYVGRDPEVLAQARKLTEQVLDNPNSVDRSLAFTAFRLAALNGDTALYDQIEAKLNSKDATPEEYYLYFQTLAEFSDPKLLQKTLDLAISPAVRSQDSLGLIASVMHNPAGTRLAWDFVRAHWSDIEKVGGGFTSGEVVSSTSSFCDAGLRDEVQDFFATHKVPTAERRLKQAIERMDYCVDLKARQTPQLSSWLEQHAAGSAGQ
jgi:aminopeptidase N/puromycin-sensitive aminopeptidase